MFDIYGVSLWQGDKILQTIYTPYDEKDPDVKKFIGLLHESMDSGEIEADRITIKKLTAISVSMIANKNDREV